MAMLKRLGLLFLINILVVGTISLILSLFHIDPFLQGYGLDVRTLMVYCLIWGMGGAFISLALSKWLAKVLMGVRSISPHTSNPEALRLIQTVHSLSREAGIVPFPEVGIFESEQPNAFATGPSRRHSLVAVSSGLLRKMSQEELEGVIGHELAHIQNGDMVTMTLIQGVVNAFVMFLARILAYGASTALSRGRGRDTTKSSIPFCYRFFVMLFEMGFMLLGMCLVGYYSRQREFRADRGGAKIAGKESMIAALESLRRLQERVRNPKVEEHPAFQSLQISDRKHKSNPLSTHPPLEERIRRLRALGLVKE